jgi:hypothetical protein
MMQSVEFHYECCIGRKRASLTYETSKFKKFSSFHSKNEFCRNLTQQSKNDAIGGISSSMHIQQQKSHFSI